MFEQFQQTVIFAHRGACGLAPENTLSSFQLAVELQADFIELDAKLSKEGCVMVIHDQTVDRTTSGSGKVKELTLSQLKALDAGTKFDARFAGEQIPTLEEVFETVGAKIMVNVELTNYASSNDTLVEKVIEVVIRQSMQKRVLFSSFLPKNLIKAKKLLPEVPVALLCLPGVSGFFSRSSLMRAVSPQILHPFLKDVNKSLITREHARGRRVHVWTVNASDDLERLIQWGIDGIFTDFPDRARKILTVKKIDKSILFSDKTG